MKKNIIFVLSYITSILFLLHTAEKSSYERDLRLVSNIYANLNLFAVDYRINKSHREEKAIYESILKISSKTPYSHDDLILYPSWSYLDPLLHYPKFLFEGLLANENDSLRVIELQKDSARKRVLELKIID